MKGSLSNPASSTGVRLALPSYAQQGLWLLHQMNPGNIGYNLPLAMRLRGTLNEVALEKSLQEILNRHVILGTRLVTQNGELLQEIQPHLEFQITKINLSDMPTAQREEEAHKEAQAEAQEPFDLQQAPLFRAKLLSLGEQENLLLITMHHIVSDGWSQSILLAELIALYSAFSQGRPSPLAALPMQYADFAESERQWLSGETLQKQLDYWQAQLTNLPPLLELPTDRSEPPTRTFQGSSYRFLIKHDLTAKLRRLARENRASMFMVLLAAWQVLLHRYSGQPDILIGTAVANRNRLQLEKLIGFFVNTLVLRVDLSGDPSFSEVLRRAREASLGAQEHPDLPFEKLMTELAPRQKPNENPFFRVMFNWLNLPASKMQLAGLKWEYLEQTITVNRFDLMLTVFEGRDELPALFEYSTDLFDESTIARFAGHLETLLASIAVNPNQEISALEYITSPELKQLFAWAGSATKYPRDLSICELFEQQAEQTPEAVALIFGDQTLSYRDLNAKANQVAHHLQSNGIQTEDRVAIYLDRCAEMIVALLGVLKSGAAYVALDPTWPTDRIALILDDTEAPLIITQESLEGHLPAGLMSIILRIDHDWPAIEQNHSSDLKLKLPVGNLAYIAYTSGSTGVPKGVAVVHRAIIRLVRENNYARLGPQEVFLQFAPVSFDASTFEIWGCLLNGGKLVIAPPGTAVMEQLGKILRQQGITTAWLTAGLFHWMVDHQLDDLRAVPQLLAGGDVLSEPHATKFLAAAGEGSVLINGYGPTENTTFTCCQRFTATDQIPASVPIGRPIANTTIYVLDQQMRLVPVGVPGELFVGGDGLARGYWDAADLTAEKFLPDPFTTEPDRRLYRSGDRTRWLRDGTLEFLGRVDNQVKIRGYRVEPGEIEAALSSHPNVREAVVLTKGQSADEKVLIAFFSSRASNEVAAEELRQYLRAKLPDYMIPSAFAPVTEFPMTANGKVDRKTLAALNVDELAETVSTPPRNATEKIIAQIWSEVLGKKSIGVENDFFELGGHSLQATQITLRLRDAFQVEDFPLGELFESPTVFGLATALQKHYDPETLEALSQALLEIQGLN